VAIGTLDSVLDFGCGCGRVVRHWAGLRGAIHGCDYNPQSVRWCQRNLTFARFAVNDLHPPLPFDAGQFDLVYALSVFTHLPEPLSSAWLDEMRRVLKPGRWLILSTHGEAYLDDLSAEQQRTFHAGQAVVKHPESAGTNRCGVYVSEGYLRRRFADGFRIVDFVPKGASGNPFQDLVLLQKS
jgi:SAM-dependent methyltransferase